MGTVFRAVNSRLAGAEVALKLMEPADLLFEKTGLPPQKRKEVLDHYRERFRREAEAAAGVKSPYLARVMDRGDDPVHGPYLAPSGSTI